MSDQTQDHSRLLILTRLLAFALLLTPLVYWPPLDFFMDSTKAFFIMAVAEVLLVVYLWLCVREPHWRPRFNIVSLAFLLFVGVLAISSVLGVDLFVSFWSESERLNGLLMWLHLSAVFVVLSSVFRTREDWNGFFFVSTLVAWVVGFIFFLSLLEPGMFPWFKMGSTTGNSTYLGAYLLFSVFFSLALALTGGSRRMRRFALFSAIVFAALILMTGALAAKGALLGGAVLGAGLWLISSPRSTKPRKRAGWAVLAALAVVFAWSWVQLLTPGSAVREKFVELSSGSRFAVWEIAWDAFVDRPVLGWGLENFPVGFYAHYRPCFGAPPCGAETWYDQAHNHFLDLLVEGGVVLFAAYVLLLAACVRAVWKSSQRGALPVSAAVLFTTFLLADAVHDLVELEVTLTWFMFVIMLAYAASLVESPAKESSKTPRLIAAIAATALLPFAFYHSVAYPWSTSQMGRVIDSTTMSQRLPLYRKMVFGSPIGQDFRRVVLAGETAKVFFSLPANKRERAQSYLQEELDMAIAGLEEVVERSPNNLRAFDVLTLMHLTRALYIDESSGARAVAVAREGLARNPRNPQAYWALAGAQIAQGNMAEALRLLDEAVALNPRIADSYLKKLALLVLAGEKEAFGSYAASVLEEFPAGDVQKRIKEFAAAGGSEDKRWVYTVFY